MAKKKSAQSIIEYALIMVMVAATSVLIMNKHGTTISGIGAHSTAEVSTGTTIDDYCNALTGTQKTECNTNKK